MKDAVLDALWKISKNSSHIKPSRLIERLNKATGLSISDLKAALGELVREGIINGVSQRGEPIGNVHILTEPPEKPLSGTEELWKAALMQVGYAEKDVRGFIKCADYLDGLSTKDMMNLIDGIGKIKANLENLQHEDPYIVSARHLLGSAKALKAVGDAFGLPLSTFQGRVAYAVVAGPPDPEAILFIENVAPFEEFCLTSASNRIMAVATFGYSLAWNNLSQELRSEKLVHLVRKGNPRHLKDVIDTKPAFFWGDLDQEGLNIYTQLKKVIPTLKLSALYLPMIESLENNQSHPYGKLAAKEKQRKIRSDDPLVAKLAALCERRAVDQELVDSILIMELCCKPLTVQDL